MGLDVHNIELNIGQGGKMARSAGTYCRFLAREGDWATLVMPSGEMRQVRLGSYSIAMTVASTPSFLRLKSIFL